MTPAVPVYTVSEWKSTVIPELSLTDADRKLADSLTGANGRLDVEELRHGIRVRAYSWVGVVRFQHFEVRVEPKLAGGSANLVDMLALTTGLEGLRRNHSRRFLDIAGSNQLLDLLALLFAQACARIVQSGLLHDYVEREEDLPVLRGRLLVAKQMRQHYGRVDRLACRYDDHLSDVVENQILAAALSVCRYRVQHPAVQLQIHRLHTVFAAACVPQKLQDLRRVREELVYHRMNAHYREAHELAWLLFDCMGIDDLLATGATRSFAFLLDMNPLFEKFTALFIAHALRGEDYRLRTQYRDWSVIWDLRRQRPYTRIIPDVLIEIEDRRRLTVDAKYKLYDDKRLSTADIYQSFFYAYAYNYGGNNPPAALLIYPASGAVEQGTYLQIRGRPGAVQAHLHAIPLSLAQAIRELKTGEVGLESQALRAFVKEYIESM